MRSEEKGEKCRKKKNMVKKRDDESRVRDRRAGFGNVSHAETIQFKSAPCVLQSLIIP